MRLFGFLMLIQNVFSLSMVDHYTTFINKYNKTYSDMNFDIFKDNIEYINRHNNQDLPYKLEMNQFTDLPPMKSMVKYKKNGHNNHLYEYNDMKDVPSSIDWREKNAVTHVKNQGKCGSCWSFSATGSIEAIHAIKKGVLLNISEQQLVDCSVDYGNHGCQGGSMDSAFKYVIDNGLCSEEDYPYQGIEEQCMDCKGIINISDYKDVIPNNEGILKRVVNQQPVSVAIQANLKSFQLYSSGIYSDPSCGTQLDHGVLIVGYGRDMFHNMDYWIVKNSWGPLWGENGYIRIQRNIENSSGLCGIAMQPSIPIN